MFEARSYNITKHTCMESDPIRFAVYLCSQAMIPISLRNDILVCLDLIKQARFFGKYKGVSIQQIA